MAAFLLVALGLTGAIIGLAWLTFVMVLSVDVMLLDPIRWWWAIKSDRLLCEHNARKALCLPYVSWSDTVCHTPNGEAA